MGRKWRALHGKTRPHSSQDGVSVQSVREALNSGESLYISLAQKLSANKETLLEVQYLHSRHSLWNDLDRQADEEDNICKKEYVCFHPPAFRSYRVKEDQRELLRVDYIYEVKDVDTQRRLLNGDLILANNQLLRLDDHGNLWDFGRKSREEFEEPTKNRTWALYAGHVCM